MAEAGAGGPEVSIIASLYGSHIGAQTLPAVARAWQDQDVPCEVVVGVAADIYDQVARVAGEQAGLRLVCAEVPENAPGRLRNIAARSARSPYLYLSDADIVPLGRDYLRRALAMSAGGRKVIAQPWMYRLFSEAGWRGTRRWQPPAGRVCCVTSDDAGKLTPLAGERFVSKERGLIQVPDSLLWSTNSTVRLQSYFAYGSLLVRRSLFEAVGGYCDEYVGWGYEDDDLFFKLASHRLIVRGWRISPALACLHFEHPRPYSALQIESNRQLFGRRCELGAQEMIRRDLTALAARVALPDADGLPAATGPEPVTSPGPVTAPGPVTRPEQAGEPGRQPPAVRRFAAPLRAVDELGIEERQGRLVVTAVREVMATGPYLAAHAAGQETYPGVFMLETVRQAVSSALGERSGELADLTAVRSLRLLGALHPGDLLTMEATVGPPGPDGVSVAEARCRPPDGTDVARLVLEFRYGPAAGPPQRPATGADTTGADASGADASGADASGSQPASGTGPVQGIAAIRTMLPSGPMVALVDQLERLVPGQTLRAVKAVTISEACYQDLAPDLPAAGYAYPASLLIESFSQAGIALWRSRPGSVLAEKGRLPVLAAARDCRLEGYAYPGDVLRHEVTFVRSVEATAFVTGHIWAGARRIATMGSVIATATLPL